MKRMLLAALAGGAAVFAWGVISHVVLPLGETGLRSLPGEEAVLSAFREAIPEPGLYFFPGMDPSDRSKEAEEAWANKYRTGPTGLLLYRPVGGEPMPPRQLVVELFTNILASLVAVAVVARAHAGYFRRVLLVAALGLFAWFSISLSYWNWYGYPSDYILAEGVDQVVSWFLAGLVIARLVGGERGAAPAGGSS